MNVFVTGFGPFLGNDDNPSAALAESCGLPFAVLPVTFRAVEEFLASAREFDALLMLGLASGEQDPRLRLEMVARNVIGATPDAEGVVAGPGPIAPMAPRQLGATLFRTRELVADSARWRPSVDAGSYLCNYSLFRALMTWPGRAVGFVHVPPVEVMPLEAQRAALADVIAHI